MKCVVTGGAGFIGSTLVDRLINDGHEVEVIDDLSSGRLANLATARTSELFSFHQLDIRDPRTIELINHCQPEVIFHLAAQADVRVSVDDPVFDASINILGSLNVLEGARQALTRRVICAASGGTLYGEPSASQIPTPETAPHQPQSPYGVSKKAMIDYLVAYRALHGLSYVALALANVYGPRQDPHGEAGVVAIFAERLLRGEPVTIFGDGDQTRDFVYVDDVVDAFCRAVNSRGDEIINIGTGHERSVNDLYAAMASVASIAQPPHFAAPRAGELLRSSLKVDRARQGLGWDALTTFEEGVRLTLAAIGEQISAED